MSQLRHDLLEYLDDPKGEEFLDRTLMFMMEHIDDWLATERRFWKDRVVEQNRMPDWRGIERGQAERLVLSLSDRDEIGAKG